VSLPPDEEAVFQAARRISDPDARREYVCSSCGGDVALADRIEELLKAHDDPDGLLREPDSTWTGMSDGADEPLDFLTPSEHPGSRGRLGQYEVLEVVGQGGFGTVLKAYHGELQRVVAIKILARQLATTATGRQRFLREARAVAAVRDDHVVEIHGVGEEKGRPYLVMEFVAGTSLQAKIDRTGALATSEVLRIGMQIASGLSAAHQQGLVHRDIKPANILLENGVERVKITDFGLARAVDDAGVTRTGVLAGTPAYMAPEQARGERVDQRADLFSLGSVMYAMCTGVAPFHADTTIAVLKRVADERPRPIRELNPDVPRRLADVVARLHAKNPADRFQTSGEVTSVLAAYLAAVQSPSGQLSDFSDTRIGSGLGRWKWIALLVVLLCGLALTETTGLTQLLWRRMPYAAQHNGPPVPPQSDSGEFVPNLVRKPVDSRAYLPLSESFERRVIDFAEIHAASPNAVIEWAKALGPQYVPIALSDHSSAEPPQVHAIAVKLEDRPVEFNMTFGRYADRGPLEQRLNREGYRTHHIRYYDMGKADIFDLSLRLNDSLAMGHAGFSIRELDGHLNNTRRNGYKPVMFTLHRRNPREPNVHTILDSSRGRWRLEPALSAEQLLTFATLVKSENLFMYLIEAYRDERGATRFAVVAWENPSGLNWVFKSGLRTAEYETELINQRKLGLRPVTVTSYGDPANPLYAAAWVQYITR
jgi:serine/threonine protein kinase